MLEHSEGEVNDKLKKFNKKDRYELAQKLYNSQDGAGKEGFMSLPYLSEFLKACKKVNSKLNIEEFI